MCVPMQYRHADGSQRKTPALLLYYALSYYLEILALIKPAARLAASLQGFSYFYPWQHQGYGYLYIIKHGSFFKDVLNI